MKITIIVLWRVGINSIVIVAPTSPHLAERHPRNMSLQFREVDNKHNYSYILERDDGEDLILCDVKDLLCYVENLSPASIYSFELRACFTPHNYAEICSAASPALDEWTQPLGKLKLSL